MRFMSLDLDGAYVVEPDPMHDERGFFARTFCEREFAHAGLEASFPQSSVSFNAAAGTLRGLHYQLEPHGETKLVRCTRGAVYDVIVDLRRHAPTFKRWFAIELSAENHKALYIPKGFAHGFLTLTAAAEVLYLISRFFSPEGAAGIRWNDPAFDITWPGAVEVISPRDASYPNFQE